MNRCPRPAGTGGSHAVGEPRGTARGRGGPVGCNSPRSGRESPVGLTRRGAAFPNGAMVFPGGEMRFPQWGNGLPRWGNGLPRWGNGVSPMGKWCFPDGETVFPSGETPFPDREMVFPHWGNGLPQWGNGVSPAGRSFSLLRRAPSPVGGACSHARNGATRLGYHAPQVADRANDLLRRSPAVLGRADSVNHPANDAKFRL
jgi:hypothetical protein